MKEVSAGIPGRRTAWLAPTLVALATIAVFSGALRNGFLNWDDNVNFLTNPHYRGLGWANLRWMFTTLHLGPYQPLSWLTCALDYLLWGMNPIGYHLTNVLLHAANAVMFYEVSLWFLSRAPVPSAGPGLSPRVAAALAALLFALHPLRVESVAWITERRDVLSGLFYLWAAYAYLRQHEVLGRSDRGWQLQCWAAFALALLAKGIVITLPAVLLALDFSPLRRLPSEARRWFDANCRHVWLEKLPFLAPALLIALVGIIGQRHAQAVLAESSAAHAAKACYGLAFYLWKTIWPAALCPMYESPLPLDPLAWPFLLSAAAVALITWRLFLCRKRWPAGLTAWVCYAVTLSPVLGLIPFGPQLAADRYSYLACLPWPLLAASGFTWAWPRAKARGRAALGLAAVMALASLAGLTWRQIGFWRDSASLWSRVLDVRPRTEIAHVNLGIALAEQGKGDEAISHYREALSIRPDHAEVLGNWGLALAGQGKVEEAIAQYREALRLKPLYAEACNNWANALKQAGRMKEATAQYREALRLKPNFPEARANLALVLAGQGKAEEAIAQYREALRLDPGDARAQENLAAALAGQGKMAEAIAHYHEALQLAPGRAAAHNNLGQALAVQGQLEEAASHCREALRLQPDLAEAHFNLGNILAVQAKAEEAAAQYRAALLIKPAFVDAHNNLGIVLFKQGKPEDARREWQETLRLDPRRESTRRNLEILRRELGKQ